LLKQAAWHEESCIFSHYRDEDQNEVDVVIENELGGLAGIEVKASATVSGSDFKGLKKLADAAGKNFRLGPVLYDGEQWLP
jgi:predicted AAA+ superfamily ATPase